MLKTIRLDGKSKRIISGAFGALSLLIAAYCDSTCGRLIFVYNGDVTAGVSNMGRKIAGIKE